MLVLRPVSLKDLDALLELTRSTGYGLTTLPADPQFLRKRILKSQRSFDSLGEQPSGEAFLLVLEDTDTGKVIGECLPKHRNSIQHHHHHQTNLLPHQFKFRFIILLIP